MPTARPIGVNATANILGEPQQAGRRNNLFQRQRALTAEALWFESVLPSCPRVATLRGIDHRELRWHEEAAQPDTELARRSLSSDRRELYNGQLVGIRVQTAPTGRRRDAA
ncbi:hypothetical protein MRX96_016400 [Rhipicephalus microplus]